MKKRISHIYIHYPFCTSRCGYCSFYTEQYSRKDQEKYLSLLKLEIKLFNELYDIVPKTIYFGGGSPSLLPPHNIQDIISCFPKRNISCEITLEANPITLTDKYIAELSKTAISRISLGIQSMSSSRLTYLGRKHNPQQVKSLIANLRARNFHNISGDLIYGLPNQTSQELAEDIDNFIKLDLDHISIYSLSLDRDAVLYSDLPLLPDDDTQANMYQLIIKKLKAADFQQYEISNFAKATFISQHNLAYWEQEDYLGIGAGAYGTISNMRYNNNSLRQWNDDLNLNRLQPNPEMLSYKDRLNEYIMLQLRLEHGLILSSLYDKYDHNIVESKAKLIKKFTDYGLIKHRKDRLFLTDKGKFISNYIISELMED